MESLEKLVNQLRVRYLGVDDGSQDGDPNRAKGTKMPHQDAQSMSEGKVNHWLQRHNQDSDADDHYEFAMAIAAAAFAITTLEEAQQPNLKQTLPEMPEASLIKAKSRNEETPEGGPTTFTHAPEATSRKDDGQLTRPMPEVSLTKKERKKNDDTLTRPKELPHVPEASLTKTTSKKDDSLLTRLTTSSQAPTASPTKITSRKEDSKEQIAFPQASDASLTRKKRRKADGPIMSLPDFEEAKEETRSSSASTRQAKGMGQGPSETITTAQKTPEETMVPTIGKVPTSTKGQQTGTTRIKSENTKDVMQRASPSSVKSAALTASNRRQKGKIVESHEVQTKADDWEKARMARIQKRYEKQRSRILQWESKKQTQARHRSDKIEMKLETKRQRATQAYRDEMERSKRIAEDARAHSEKNKRNDEVKITEKANKIRSTGKVPKTCLCF